jgi:PAS domain S-box-containing protein
MGKLNFYKKDDDIIYDSLDTWKILIADDEEDVHTLTKTVLSNFTYKNKKLEFISTYTGKDTIEAVKNNDDIILILLDVIMESDDAGLQVVKQIREEIHNDFIQIVLRTGQSGLVPEHEVVMNYAINDYKEKTELTSKKLFTTIVTAIRSYENIRELYESKDKIELLNYDLNKLIDSFDKNVMACKIDEDGKLIYVSESMCQTLGYAKDDLVGQDTSIFIHPDFESYSSVNLKQAYKTHKPWTGEVMFRTKSHETVWVLVKRTVEFDANNKFLNFTSIIYDITAQKYMENANKEIELLNEEIIETQKEVVFRLGEIAETRSKETGMHVKRVAEYSRLLAKYYGLTESETEILKMASPMHDVGKVAIPDKILNKPGRFTPEEFEVMKTHSQIGYEMLKTSNKPILQAAAIIAHQHQEKYDGSGYPQGLEGEDIHIFGRITAVADVFDALGSDRVYKKAWKDEQIFTLLENQRGKHFDPVLIDLFFKNLDEFLKIRDTFKDI